MTIIDNTTVRWDLSPRLFWMPESVDNPTVQDLVDTARKVHEYNLMNLSMGDHLVDASGKENLGGIEKVGITATGRNMQVAFDFDPTPKSIGTITTPDTNGETLIDSAGDFENEGVDPGAWIVNITDKSISVVITVDSPTQISCLALGGGTDNQWDNSDEYIIWNVTQKTLLGGNFVSVDDVGADISSIFPTPLTQVVVARASSATLQELASIQYASFGGGVTVDDTSPYSGTGGLTGNQQFPVNNIPDAVQIAANRGFSRLYIINVHTIDTGDNIENLEIFGESPRKTVITVNDGAETQNAEFHNCTVTGIFDNEADFYGCTLQDIAFVYADIYDCILEGTITLSGSGSTRIIRSYSGIDGTGTPTIDMGGTGQSLQVRQYSGGIKIINLTSNENISLDFVSGHAKIDSTVTAGTIVIRGFCQVTDESVGATVITPYTAYNMVNLMTRNLGLAQENQAIDQHSYDDNDQLESARIRTYSSAGSVGTDNDVIATYTMTATYSGSKITGYQVVEV